LKRKRRSEKKQQPHRCPWFGTEQNGCLRMNLLRRKRLHVLHARRLHFGRPKSDNGKRRKRKLAERRKH